jgi:hypothetical protein
MSAWPSARLRAASPWIGVAALALAGIGLRIDPSAFWAAWLAAWCWSLGLVLGSLTNGWMHRLTGGRWGEAVRPAGAAVARRMPWVLLLGVPLLAGLSRLYPWFDAPAGWSPAGAHPAFTRQWLSPSFFAVRLLLYAVAWWWLSRVPWPARKGRAALALIVQLVVGTLAAIDLLMSLTPAWFSSVFGLLVLSVQALGGAALLVLLSAPRSMPATRDLGNLLLMWTLLWSYLEFMQWLIVWSENLPREILWYLPRLDGGWEAAGIALALLQGVVPGIALLFRAVKDRPQRLAAVAALLLAASALDAAWRVLPSVAPHSPHAGWLLPLLFGGMGLLLFGRLPATESRDGHA